MAKKKKAGKKAAKKVAKKKASGVAAAQECGFCSDQELVAAGFVDDGGELVARLTAVVNATVQSVIREFLNSRSAQRTTAEVNGQNGWDYAREQLRRRDFVDMPYVRVVGRVAEILLNRRRFKTCKIADVSTVFLAEIPDQLEVHHRQNPPLGQQLSLDSVDASAWVGKKTFTERITRLCDEELIRPTSPPSQGAATKYALTEDGQNMFDGWPPLTEIPGLEFDGLVTPESRSRRRSRRRS